MPLRVESFSMSRILWILDSFSFLAHSMGISRFILSLYWGGTSNFIIEMVEAL